MSFVNKLFDSHHKRTITICIVFGLTIFSSLFVSYDGFVEAEVLPKWYVSIWGSILLGFTIFLTFNRIILFIDSLSLTLFVFLGYVILRIILSDTSVLLPMKVISFALLFVLFRILIAKYEEAFNMMIVSSCIALSVYGILQYCGIFFYSNIGFKVTGNFDNPAGFAACLSIGFPFCFKFFNKSKHHKYIGLVSTFLLVTAIMLSCSRAGIVTIFITILIYFIRNNKVDFNKYFWRVFPLYMLIGLTFIGLFILKKDSAIGRILIWSNSISMIADKPVFGHGPGSFLSEYMLYQANFFKANPNSIYSQLADIVSSPFNEYIHLIIEYGLVGLLLLILCIITIFFFSNISIIPLLCLSSITTFACFSYPLRYPFVIILIAYSLANCSNRQFLRIVVDKYSRLVFLLFSLFFAIMLVTDIRFEFVWGKLQQKARIVGGPEVVERYDHLYERWNANPLFLYNYGAILNKNGLYLESNSIMTECVKTLNDYDVQMVIADNYFELRNYFLAESHYQDASYMCPNRFMPLYRLTSVYDSLGLRDKSLEIAQLIINKDVKIPSASIVIMKSQMAKKINDAQSY